MTSLPCAVHDWIGGTTLPTVPTLPETGEPPRAAPQPGAQAERWRVAVASFPSGAFRGVLWQASIESMPSRARHLGGNSIRITVPATPTVMRILGVARSGWTDRGGRQVYSLRGAGRLELVVGSDLDGLARRRFYVRQQITVADGVVTINGVGIIGGLTSDRVIGAPTRLNLIRSNASFEQGTLAGWRLHGGVTAQVVDGGVDGAKCVRVRGPVGAYLERKVEYSQTPQPWGRQRIAGTAMVRLPSGLDIDDFALVTIAVYSGDKQVWPDARRGDPEAGVVTSDMVRGSWITDAVIGVGYLPTPPYTATVCLRLYPVDEAEWTYFDDAQIIRRENTSTTVPKDLVDHPQALFHHAQAARGKSDWGVGVVEGAPTGIVEVGTWWHEDGTSMNEALEKLGGRGLDMWDLPGPGRRVAVAKRQGRIRNDLRVHEWDMIKPRYGLDPGAQRTAARAVSAAGSIWGGADEGLILDDDLVIDVILTGPSGMTPSQLKKWLREQLAPLTKVPVSSTVRLRWPVGILIEVGDTIWLPLRSRSAGEDGWYRVTETDPDLKGFRYVDVTVGRDPEMEGT